MAQIDILMATYNGGMYVKQQILSIIGQSFEDWKLIIHDDGSADNTIGIIKLLAEHDSRIFLIEDNIKCGGAAQNFMHLTKLTQAEYIMFADQDDIWFDNKLQMHIDLIKTKDNTMPQVVYSNAYVWKANEGIKGVSTLTFPKVITQFLFLNSGMQGCVAMFNKKMSHILSDWTGQCAMHDHLLHLAGLMLGEVTYIRTPLMLYRNHNNNVTGETTTSTAINIKSISKNKGIPVVDNGHYNVISLFHEKYNHLLTKENDIAIKRYIKMKKESTLKRIFSVIKFNYRIFNSSARLIFKILMRPYIN